MSQDKTKPAGGASRLEPIVGRGCGNHGCYIRQPTGQGTNGPCACDKFALRREILRMRKVMLDAYMDQDWRAIAAEVQAPNASLSGRGDEPNYEVKPAGPRSA